MSEGVFGLPRNTNTVALLRAGPLTFGTAGQVVSAKSGCLYQASCVNKGAITYFLQMHDKATAPVAADTPIWEMKLPASGEFNVSFGLFGFYFANGISFALSTTAGTLTLAAAADAVLYTRHTAAG